MPIEKKGEGKKKGGGGKSTRHGGSSVVHNRRPQIGKERKKKKNRKMEVVAVLFLFFRRGCGISLGLTAVRKKRGKRKKATCAAYFVNLSRLAAVSTHSDFIWEKKKRDVFPVMAL